MPSMAPGRDAPQHSRRSRARTGKPAPSPVGDDERERIRSLHGQGLSCNAIAKEIGRSASTVTRQCRQMGLSFDRSATRDAVQAHVIDAKARRAALSLAFLENAERLNAQMFAACEDMAPVGGMEPTVLRWNRDEPSFADKEKIARGAGVLADKHLKLAQFDSDDGAADAKALLSRIGEALGVAAQSLAGDQQPDG